MKHYNSLAWMMAIAIASMSTTACSSSDADETPQPLTTVPVESPSLYAYGILPSGTRSVTDSEDFLFTENDIEWFDIGTREIKWKDMDEPLYQRMSSFHKIRICLDDEALLVISSFVGAWDSRIYDNLVLCYIPTDDKLPEADGRYYLYDCYPLQFIDTDEVKTNREKNAILWDTFTKYLDSKGKLKK